MDVGRISTGGFKKEGMMAIGFGLKQLFERNSYDDEIRTCLGLITDSRDMALLSQK